MCHLYTGQRPSLSIRDETILSPERKLHKDCGRKGSVAKQKLWEELIAYFPLIRHRPHRKRFFQQFFVAAGTSLSSCYLAMIGGHRQAHRLSFEKTRTAQKMTRPTVILLRVFAPMGMCLPSHCLATKERIHFTVPLQRLEGYTHRLMGGIYEVRH
jgi:hypothetical protein